MYNYFEIFLLTVYNFAMVYTFSYRCFKLCSDWTRFHEKLSFLKQAFFKKKRFFKTFHDKFFIKRPQVTTGEKKTVFSDCHTLENFLCKLEQS